MEAALNLWQSKTWWKATFWVASAGLITSAVIELTDSRRDTGNLIVRLHQTGPQIVHDALLWLMVLPVYFVTATLASLLVNRRSASNTQNTSATYRN